LVKIKLYATTSHPIIDGSSQHDFFPIRYHPVKVTTCGVDPL
jgi:hypothetical protein